MHLLFHIIFWRISAFCVQVDLSEKKKKNPLNELGRAILQLILSFFQPKLFLSLLFVLKKTNFLIAKLLKGSRIVRPVANAEGTN